MVGLLRGISVVGLAVNVGFVVWEIVDYRSAYALSNALCWTVISGFCTGVTWVATEDLKESK